MTEPLEPFTLGSGLQEADDYWMAELQTVYTHLDIERQRNRTNSQLLATLINKADLHYEAKTDQFFGASGPEPLWKRLQRRGGELPPEELTEKLQAFWQLVNHGENFLKIMEAINSNEILKAQWNKLLMSLKLLEGTDDSDKKD